jgi:hypothetical protein
MVSVAVNSFILATSRAAFSVTAAFSEKLLVSGSKSENIAEDFYIRNATS